VHYSNTHGSTIGGASPGARNLISGNSFSGVLAQNGSSGNKIEGNLLGTDKSGTADLGTDDTFGVIVFNSSNNTIGDSDPSDGAANAANTIAFHSLDGVGVDGGSSTGNRILSNSIYANGDLGIDLNPDGVAPNDPKDPDTGPNRLQNLPLITSATTLGSFTSINGTLESTPSTRQKKRTFTVQLFSNTEADPSGYGEGKTFLGQILVSTNRNGNASFTFTPALAVPEGAFVTATATNKATGDTSEFSNAKRVEELVIAG
jgi:large repetitive protein